jgi:hypothetical protein
VFQVEGISAKTGLDFLNNSSVKYKWRMKKSIIVRGTKKKKWWIRKPQHFQCLACISSLFTRRSMIAQHSAVLTSNPVSVMYQLHADSARKYQPSPPYKGVLIMRKRPQRKSAT